MPTPAHLQREHHQGHTDHDDHQQLRGPDLGGDIPIAHSRKGDDAEVEGREQGQVLARTLQVLDPASSGGCHSHPNCPMTTVPSPPDCCGKVLRTQDWGMYGSCIPRCSSHPQSSLVPLPCLALLMLWERIDRQGGRHGHWESFYTRCLVLLQGWGARKTGAQDCRSPTQPVAPRGSCLQKPWPHSPCEHQAEQGAEEDEHLVEHG